MSIYQEKSPLMCSVVFQWDQFGPFWEHRFWEDKIGYRRGEGQKSKGGSNLTSKEESLTRVADEKGKRWKCWQGWKRWDRTALSLETMWGNPTAHKDLIGHKNLWLTKFTLCWSGNNFLFFFSLNTIKTPSKQTNKPTTSHIQPLLSLSLSIHYPFSYQQFNSAK